MLAVAVSVLGVLGACSLDPSEGGTRSSGSTVLTPPPPSASPGGEPVVVTAAGDVTAAVEEFRSALGPDNGGGPGGDPAGRREVNWDGVPDELAAPNALPPDFFAAAIAPRARGLVLAPTGGRLVVSADSDNPTGTAVRFGDLNPSYAAEFRAFSEERLFTPVGTTDVDVTFRVPGSDQPALVRGFGAVYADVDSPGAAVFEYFDADEVSLGSYELPVGEDALSFLGVAYEEPVVARVRIAYPELGPDDGDAYDVVVMDDFVYGEPRRR